MPWLPGYALFGSHTPIFWINLVLGAALGFVVTHLRSQGSRYEGRRWMLMLGTVAGGVGGVTIFLFLGVMTLMFYLLTRRMHTAGLAVSSVLAQLALFVYFVIVRGRR